MRFIQPHHNNHNTSGFTLIEMLVIAPIVLLAIGGFVALMVSMIGDVLATRDYNTITYNSQDSLNRIEQDVRLSAQFLTTTGTTSPQQGSNNNYSGTAPFTITSTNNTLILSIPATDKNPTDSTRQIINYANQPNPCGTSQTANNLFSTKVVYFVNNGSLWRRTILPPYDTNSTVDNNTVCSVPWQQNSCVVGYTSDGHCQTNDAELMKNVQSMTVQYFADPASTTDVGVAGAATASTVNVTITAASNTAGRSATTSQSLRATKLNDLTSVAGTSSQTPLTVTQQPSNTSVLASDTNITIPASSSVSTASVLWQQSSDNGTTWQDMANQTSATLLLPSVDMSWNNRQFRAIFTSGSSSVTTNTATLTVTLWGSVALQNGWGNYGSPNYSNAMYTKTSAGLVILKGMTASGSTTWDSVMAVLPVGYRPAVRMSFYVGSYSSSLGSGFGRVDVLTNGEVHFMNGTNTWVSLDSIKFMDTAATCTATSTLSPINGWANVSVPTYGAPTLCKDSTGRIDASGFMTVGTTTLGTSIATIPSGYQSAESLIVPAVDSTGNFGSIGISPGALTARGMGTSYESSNDLYIANNGAVSWQTPTILNGMTNYGGSYATIQYGKTSDGVVMIKGLLKGGTVANGTTVFTLPSGYRPSTRMLLPGVANQHHMRVDVDTSGNVIIQGSGDTAWSSFDAVNFLADGS